LSAFNLGATVRVTALMTDPDTGDAVEPNNVTIRIDLPDNTISQAETAMTNTILGTYLYYYTISAEPTGQIGIYPFRITVTGALDRKAIYKSSFTVEASI